MFLNVSEFEPIIILKLILNTKGINSSKILRNVVQSLLIFCYIMKLSISIYIIFCIDNAKVHLKVAL